MMPPEKPDAAAPLAWRLNRYLARAGLGSRRACDELILKGQVTVDGVKVTEPGTRVLESQTVAVEGRRVQPQKQVYWLVHKPKGYLCTNYDPAGRPRALDLVPHVHERMFTVGRLDEESEGLLLLTNDGGLAQRLTHPRFGIEKTYLVQVAGRPAPEVLSKLTRGIYLAEGVARAKRVKLLGERGQSSLLEVVLAEGKNREIRRVMAKVGHKVLHLKRVALGPLELARLKKGKCRPLMWHEIAALRRIAGLEAAAAPAAAIDKRPAKADRSGKRQSRPPRRPPRPAAAIDKRPARADRSGKRQSRPPRPAKKERSE